MNADETLVNVKNVSKKFCRTLRKSLMYGLTDMAAELMGLAGRHDRLRSEEFWAVDDVSFDLKRGECLGLIGPNGAGKTTLLKMLNGLIKPDHGRIEMRGRVGALIALGAGFNPVLTGRENVYVNGAILGLSTAEIDEKMDGIIDFADIREFIDSPVQSYSSGMAVRLGFAIASSSRPDILLLDEVLAVGDMAFQAKCFNRLGEARRQGTGFVLVSHNMHHVLRFCDRALLAIKGRMTFLGAPREAVELYYRHMDAVGERAPAHIESAGSKRVLLAPPTLSRVDGTPIEVLTPGETFRITWAYESFGQLLADPTLDVVLRDDGGDILIQTTNRDCNFSLGTFAEQGLIEVEFADLPLNGGRLTLSCALWEHPGPELVCWQRGIVIPVVGRRGLLGRLHVDARWQHLTQVAHAAQPALVRSAR